MKDANEHDQKTGTSEQEDKKTPDSATKKMDDLQKEADKSTGEKKPGSQSNSSKQHNNGRGGGK